MTRGRIFLFCPICGQLVNYDQAVAGNTAHHREFGVMHRECLPEAEKKYAKLVVGKREE